MTPTQALVLRNILNGIEPVPAAQAAGLAEDQGLVIFNEAMRRVAEYQLVHCVPHFPVIAIAEARRNKRGVMEILAKIQDWDDGERELAMAILKGRNVLKEGADRADAERVLNTVLEALPHYLEAGDIPAYARDRRQFVREHRSRVLDAVERFPSFREPFQYKPIEHQYIQARPIS